MNLRPSITLISIFRDSWLSVLAVKLAQDMGLQPVAHIKGGMKAWLDENLPIEAPVKKVKIK